MNYSNLPHKQFENITPYSEVNLILEELLIDMKKILGANLKALYLFGSLVYGDFKRGSSDIDLVAIVNKPLNESELKEVKSLHEKLELRHPDWKNRLECSYTPCSMLSNVLPPREPRPYYGGGIFYAEADYGNEWIINNYLLYKYSLALAGSDFMSLVKPIDIVEVQKACIRDLFKEWEPKINDSEWLDNDHYQSYLILNLCRILYTVFCGKTASKVGSAQWVKTNHPQWKTLIESAENWEYERKMGHTAEAIRFIKFTVNEIKKTELFGIINSLSI